ncbi:tRNA pseudouridine(55) synthase TruB, partial [Hyphomonas adhaerens]
MARQRKRKGDPVTGWLNLFKPVDMTSTQAVAILKRRYNAAKVGHGGTLDPLADGILPIAFGEATKTVQWAMDAEKEYVFTIRWGISTASQDAEGEATATSDARPTRDEVEDVLRNYVGTIEQVPPKYSAIKVDGQRAYDLAREGEDFELKPREVDVFEAAVIGMPDPDHTVIHVTSGKGFYVRAMARDLAFDLGCEG